MRHLSFAFSLLAAAAALAASDPSEHVVEPLVVETVDGEFVEGHLDWTGGTITVTGEAVAPESVTNPVQRRLLGFRAAKVVALRALLEVVGGVQVDARTTVSLAMVASDTIRARVEGMVRGARVVPGSRREEGGLYRLEVSLDLLGDLADAVLPDTAVAGSLPPTDLPADDSLIVFVPPVPHTGLVVDARGTTLRPSMSPRVVDDAGRLIYSADHVDRDYAVHTGVVGYVRDLHDAVVSDRVGGAAANPFLVEAVGVAGLYNSDVVVTRDMGTRILMADMEGDFLSQCRVLFVVGSKPEPPPPAPVFSAAATTDSLVPAVYGDFLDSVLQTRALADTVLDSMATGDESRPEE